jgi:hypothetical protein
MGPRCAGTAWHGMTRLRQPCSPQELRLYTDYGRCCRPLFIVEDQAIKVGLGAE